MHFVMLLHDAAAENPTFDSFCTNAAHEKAAGKSYNMLHVVSDKNAWVTRNILPSGAIKIIWRLL